MGPLSLTLCSLEGEYLRESEWIDLSGFKSEFKSELCVVFLRDLEVIVGKFRSNFCESL